MHRFECGVYSLDTSAHALLAVRHWVQHVIIGHHLCPFAKDASTRTGYWCAGLPELESSISKIIDVLTEPNARWDNILLVLPKGADDFDTFWDMCEMLEVNFELSGLDEHVQLAHFHPLYRFEGLGENDRANWTNRAPFPILHFLSAAAVARAVNRHPDTAAIPDRNVAYLRSLTDESFRSIFGA